MKRLFFIVFPSLILLFEKAGAQQQYIQFRQLSTAHGLSSPVVYDITQDREGFIWIATNKGINRYDGQRFEVFVSKKNDKHSLIHSTVQSICIDTSDRVWAGTNSGISRFNKKTNSFDRYLLKPIESNEELTNRITEIYCDHNGTVWAATEQGLFRYDAESDRFSGFLPNIPLSHGNRNFFFTKSLVHDTLNQGLWCSISYELCFFDFKTEKFFHHQNNPKHWKIFDELHYTAAQSMTRGGFLVFNDNGEETLFIYDLKNHLVKKEIRSDVAGFNTLRNTFLCAFVDSQDRIWMGNWALRPVIIDWENEQVDTSLFSETYPGMMNSRVLNDGFVSDDGTYWLATSNGIYLYHPQKLLYQSFWLKRNRDLFRENISFTLPDGDQKIWLATNGYLIHYDLKTRSEEWLHLNLDGHHWDITCLAFKNENELWVGTVLGLVVYDRRQKNFFKAEFPLEFDSAMNKKIQFVFTDSKNNTWIGLWSYGLLLKTFDRKWEWLRHNPSDPNSLPSNELICITETEDGKIWLGFNRGSGAASYDPASKRFEVYKQNASGLSYGVVNALLEDVHGNLWIGTHGGGLNKLDRTSGKFTQWRDYDGLASNFIFRINEDYKGKLWITTSQGVSVLDPRNETFAPFPADLHFGGNDLQASGTLSSEGKIYFFKDKGFIEADPSKNFESPLPAKVVLTSFEVFDKEIPFQGRNEALKLSYSQNFFSFEFSALEWIEPEKIEYSYLLEGFDKEWNAKENRHYAAYTNVPAGNYVFMVKASRHGATDSVPVRLMTLTISPPFWETWWFRILILGVILAMIYAAFFIRDKIIRKQERQKAALQQQIQETEMKALRAQMNPHFIFNCMNAIQNFIYQNDEENAIQLLQKFAELIRKILDNSEKRMITLSEDIALLEDYIRLEQLRTESLFDYHLEMSDQLDVDGILIPSMLLQPFVENAIWHGLMPAKRKGMLNVSITGANGLLYCTVTDNGVGRKHRNEDSGIIRHKPKGIIITQERLQLMAQKLQQTSTIRYIDLKNEDGTIAGTKVEIEIPVMKRSDKLNLYLQQDSEDAMK